jgi:signal transduction histidine kinase
LGNAVEFSNRGGKITICIEENKTGLSVAIIDNGPGISPTDQEVIFDRFRQLDAGTTKEHRGHGLGLSICWALAELLGGTLDLDSQPEQGSRFVLEIPRPDVDTVMYASEGNFFIFDETDEDVETF